ncbi:MAG: sigma-70 family RNA polymerase sigma factor [Parcubacteria group bacterium]|nr:sigma-70 family RNA polymerase sigma factor [Parcubacteria group bacterium]
MNGQRVVSNELVEKTRKGNTQAFDKLAGIYYPIVYQEVQDYAVPELDAEDVTQEVFFMLIFSVKRIRDALALNRWFDNTIRRKVALYRRKSFDHNAMFIPIVEVKGDVMREALFGVQLEADDNAWLENFLELLEQTHEVLA